MLFFIAPLILGASLFVLHYVYNYWRSQKAFHIAAARFGCQRPVKYPHKDPIWGHDLAKKRTKAVRAGRQMDLFMEHFNTYGKTWEEKFYDARVINTMESRNIQQVCALDFQYYGKPSSTKITSPFIGKGIFSEDGPSWKHSRDLIKPIFSRAELSDIDSFSFHVDRFLDLIPRDGTTIDLQGPLHKLVLVFVVYNDIF